MTQPACRPAAEANKVNDCLEKHRTDIRLSHRFSPSDFIGLVGFLVVTYQDVLNVLSNGNGWKPGHKSSDSCW